MSGYNFTDRVRRVLQLARDEAARLHHDYIGTEHILLGLIAEGGGVAIATLRNLGIDPESIRRTIDDTVKKGTGEPGEYPELPYTSRAKRILELAMTEARELQHTYVGTEHILLGLIREEKGIAAQLLLGTTGISLDQFRAEVVRIVGTEAPSRRPVAPRAEGHNSAAARSGYDFTERVRKVLRASREAAARLRHDYVGTEHILLGILTEGEGVAIATLRNLSVDPEELKKKVEQIAVPGNTADGPTGPELPYTSRAKKALEFAMITARELNHNYVGTEHLLIGLLREEKGIAAQVLFASGLQLEAMTNEVVRLLGTDRPAKRMNTQAMESVSSAVTGARRWPGGRLATILKLGLAVCVLFDLCLLYALVFDLPATWPPRMLATAMMLFATYVASQIIAVLRSRERS